MFSWAGHARYMADLVGVDYIACGFDYMDFLIDYDDDDNAVDMADASMSQNLIEALKKWNFTDEEIKKVAFYNVYDFLREQL